MNGPEFFASIRKDVAQNIAQYEAPKTKALDVSKWLAMSIFQKAVRRGETALACRAAKSLMLHSTDNFWRRCGIIAFEDVGVADIDCVGTVTALLSGKRARAQLGTEWQLASYLVERLCAAPKCRAADDLLMIVEHHPSLASERDRLASLNDRALMSEINFIAPLPNQALALWYAIGTDRYRSSSLKLRQGAPIAVFDALLDTEVPYSSITIANEGLRRTRSIITAFLPLLVHANPFEPTVTTDDALPPTVMIGDVPSWSIDMFTVAGKLAMSGLLRRDCQTARWMRSNVATGDQIGFLGNIVFAVESGLLKRRYRWETADNLRHMAEIESQGPYCNDATEIMSLIRADLPLLNEERTNVL